MLKKMGFMVLMFFLVACQNNLPEDVAVEERVVEGEELEFDSAYNHYDIKATLNTEKHQISAKQKLTYTNREGLNLDKVYFHLFPNAFKKDGHPSLFDAKKDEITNQYGYVDVKSILIDGQVVSFEVEDTLLVIEGDFLKDRTYTIDMDYVVYIPSASERFGYVNEIYNLGNWYPILAVYDEDGWNLDPYYHIGDPFYSDISNYTLELTVPTTYVVAASGHIDAMTEGENKTYTFIGQKMRDFALVISERFDVMSRDLEGTLINIYYPRELNQTKALIRSLETTGNSLKLYGDIMGPYPYKSYAVVITNFPSGMEYPGLVLISENYFGADPMQLDKVIIHETVHQWFYGLIGNDQVDEAWIDEGFTTFLTSYYNKVYRSQSYFEGEMASYQKRLEDNPIADLDKSLSEYEGWGDYGVSAYTKPAVMLYDLYETYGEEKLLAYIKAIYDNHQYRVVKTQDLEVIAREIFGQEVQETLDRYIRGDQ